MVASVVVSTYLTPICSLTVMCYAGVDEPRELKLRREPGARLVWEV